MFREFLIAIGIYVHDVETRAFMKLAEKLPKTARIAWAISIESRRMLFRLGVRP